tara:strand:- start:490 stop:1830 length:1341 start_codon:yes stop_codon:yes gene_type:complete
MCSKLKPLQIACDLRELPYQKNTTMKSPTLILYLTVWSISLAAAYYIGSHVENAPQDTDQAVKVPSDSKIPKLTLASAVEEVTTYKKNALTAYLSGDVSLLEDAFLEIPALSSEATRELLVQAFDLPASDPNRSRLIRDLLRQLAEREPVAALELASQMKSLRDSQRARVAVLEVWGLKDPAAAIAWANNALVDEPSRARNSQLMAIYRGYAANNPAAAFQQALAINDNDRLKNQLLDQVIKVQIESGGLQAAKIAVDLLADPEMQRSLRRELVDEWAEFDPKAAAAYVATLGENADPSIKSALVSEWAESDPAAAAAWLSNLDVDDPTIARASSSIIREWTRYDLAASADWLNSLPASPELDRAVITYTFRAAEEDPETAMSWASSIEDDRRRTWMMERVASTWKEQDIETFKNYLDKSGLSTEQREKLENSQSRGNGYWGRRRD